METSYFSRELEDPFVNNVVRNMPEDIQASFSDEQAEALIAALSKAYSRANHYVDVRISLHLFFARYYCIFLMGKDLRKSVRSLIIGRRQKASFAAGLFLVGVLIANAIIFCLVGAFFILYIIKASMGIDIFPGIHLWDLLFG